MKWNIYEYASGCIVATVEARTAREALLKYLMEHEELNDMMLWKSTDRQDGWRLAEYDNEDEFLYAKANWEATNLWDLFTKLPMEADMKLVDRTGRILAESYGSLHIDDFDEAKILSVQLPEEGSDIYTVTIEMEEKE